MIPEHIVELLRQRLLDDMKQGTVVGARGSELIVLLDDIEEFLRMPGESVQQLQIKLAALRAVMERGNVFLRTPSHHGPLPPDGTPRARMHAQLRSLLELVVHELLAPLHSPGERHAETDLARRIFQLDASVLDAADDNSASGFWPSLRGLAISVANHARRGHLALARPIFSAPEPALDVSAVFFSGGDSLRTRVAAACARRGLSLVAGQSPGPVAFGRWSELRSAAVAVFDLTIPRGPGLSAVCY